MRVRVSRLFFAPVGAGDVPDNSRGLVFGKFLLVEEFAAAGGEAVEERLGDVGQDGGVAAGDEAAGGHAEEVSQELVDGCGGGEVLDGAEKLGGEGFSVLGLLRLLGMVRTEGRVAFGAREAATAPRWEYLLTLSLGVWITRHLIDLSGDGGTSERWNVPQMRPGCKRRI